MRLWRGESASLRRRTATSCSRKETWLTRSSVPRAGLPPRFMSSSWTATALTSSWELRRLRPYLWQEGLKPLDQQDCPGVSDLHPCECPHACTHQIPTSQRREASASRVCWSRVDKNR